MPCRRDVVTTNVAKKPGDVECVIGEPAPDLFLPRLVQRAELGKKTLDPTAGELVRLSSFRGKKVVCIFLSSYT